MSHPPKHILLLNTQSFIRGGIQHVAQYVEELLKSNSDFSVSIITYDPAKKLNFFRDVRRALIQSDVVISMHLSLQIALLGSSVPSIQFIHGIELEHHPAWLTKYLLSQADSLFCSTKFVYDSLTQLTDHLPPVKQSLYPSPLFPDNFELKNGSDNNEILLVSRLTKSDRYKGVVDVIEVYASENYRYLPHLKIVGEGDDRHFLESLVTEHGLQAKITFSGLLSNKDLRNAFRSAAGFILMSSKEGQGLVYVEALSYGLPVLALKNTVAEELIDHGESGFLADKNDREGIKDYLRKMVHSEEMRFQARKKFEALHIEERFSQKLIQTLNTCAE